MQTSLLLEMASDAFPDRVAVGSQQAGQSFGELAACARAGAAWLHRQGGETVVFLGLNGAEAAVAMFAAALCGKAYAPINYRLPDEALRRLVARTAPSVAVVDDDMASRIAGVEAVTILPRSRFVELCQDKALREAPPPEVQSDVAIHLFTSGTTGEPKAAVLRHRHLTAYVISTVEFMGADETEAALVSVPPYHIAAVSAVLTGAYGGRRSVYLPVFSASSWVEAAKAEAITHAMVVPTMLGQILDVLEMEGESLPSLRALSYGGGRMPLAVIERALRLLPQVDFVNAYGLTETSSTVAILGPEEHRRAFGAHDPDARRRLGSVGRPLPSLELEIRAPDGRVLGPGLAGEIYVRGEQVAGEYLHRKVISEEGWFATNDEGWLDAEGYLYVEGRLDDVIIRGGENISPGEIEDTLRQHPLVADVAVFGVPDERWGEKVAAVVVVAMGAPLEAGDLADWAKSRLKSTKTPESWSFEDALPYNETGKLLRRVLKQRSSAPPATAG